MVGRGSNLKSPIFTGSGYELMRIGNRTWIAYIFQFLSAMTQYAGHSIRGSCSEQAQNILSGRIVSLQGTGCLTFSVKRYFIEFDLVTKTPKFLRIREIVRSGKSIDTKGIAS